MSLDWNERYQLGDTPWDKGVPHPELPFLLREHGELLSDVDSVLVPGCGIGHDARFIRDSCDCRVTGLDVAETAISRARRHHADALIDWRVGDLFSWEEKFDLVFEHTCFCAIPIERRPDYVDAVSRLLPPGGHLLGIFFLNPDHEGEEGPPFGVSPSALQSFFEGSFDRVWSEPPGHTYPGREGEGRELCVLLRRRTEERASSR